MNQKQNLSRMIERIVSVGLGLLSIAGGIAAIGRTGEPERYFASAVVMILGGVLWLGYSIFPNDLGTQKKSVFIGLILFLGLTLGVLYTFNFCGGECGCFQYRGYPGYWLKGSTCVTSPTVPIKMSHWDIDISGLLADIVFWIDAGLILSFVWKPIHSKLMLVENQR